MKSFMSTRETSEKWKISERRIQKLCIDGRVEGATKIGKAWIIPSGTEKPEDKRRKEYKKYFAYPSDCRIKEMVYGKDIRLLSRSENGVVYARETKTGKGIITGYNVYPGIDVYYNDFQMKENFNQNQTAVSNIMEINYCLDGRFEAELRNGEHVFLSRGDLAVHLLSQKLNPRGAGFPLAYYHGICILLDLPVAINSLQEISQALGGVKIDLTEFRRKNRLDDKIAIIRASNTLEHIFSEMYNTCGGLRIDFLKVKILELLIFLSAMDMSVPFKQRHYLGKKQIEIVKAIKEYLVRHLDEHITLAELSAEFNISLTSMKKCFKIYFGTPVSTFIREYRLQAAAQLLQQTDKTIAEIAETIGYENPAKFTVAFQKFIKQTPSSYRKKFRLIR